MVVGDGGGGMPGQVLVVDDDEALRDLVVEVLRPEGYDVRAVPNAAAGLAALADSPADVIFLDTATWRASDRDRAFIERYRATPGPHAPVILFTAATHAEEAADDLGADGLLTKPFDIAELVALARRYIGA